MSTATSTITVRVEDPASRDQQLEGATSLLREKAVGYGILVTRVDYTTFTVTLSPEVAYGQTLCCEESLMPRAIGGHVMAMATQDEDPEAGQRRDDAEKHPLLIWTGLDPGDVVSLRAWGKREYVGTVEQRTKDGLIIWIRDDLNERKLFHFRDCQSVVLVASISH